MPTQDLGRVATLPGRQADEGDGCLRRYQRKAAEDDDPGQEAALSTGHRRFPKEKRLW